MGISYSGDQMKKVLDVGDASPGPMFVMYGGRDSVLMCDTYVGGSWNLQTESPEGVWLDTDVKVTGLAGGTHFFCWAGMRCRFAGGSTGARIYVTRAV